MASIYLGKYLRANSVRKFFIETFKYQKYTKFIQNCPKMTIFNFCRIGCKILKQKRL